VTDDIWEFCCGPHNSVHHVPALDESDRPATEKFKFAPRECDIRWSSYIPRAFRGWSGSSRTRESTFSITTAAPASSLTPRRFP